MGDTGHRTDAASGGPPSGEPLARTPSGRGPALQVPVREPPGQGPGSAVLLLAGLLVVGGTATAGVVASLPDARPSATSRPSSTARPSVRSDEAAVPPALGPVEVAGRLLDQRARAARTGDVVAWTGVVAPEAVAFRVRQQVALRRLRLLPISSFRYEVIGADAVPVPPSAGPSSRAGRTYLVHARLHYRLAKDSRDVLREQYLTMVGRAGGWFLTGDADARTQRALWDLGELQVRAGRRCLVIGVGAVPAAQVAATADTADAAAADVDMVWGTSGPRSAVIVVPSDRATLAAVLDRPDGDALDQVAAITSGEVGPGDGTGRPQAAGAGSAGGAVADRVIVNPGAFDRLTDVGRRVVLTHELTHVATRATARIPPPLWVEEGFANYVAYHRWPSLDPKKIAEDTLRRVQLGAASSGLPAAEDFDPSRSSIAAAYADAWLAFRLMARTGRSEDPRVAVAFYRVAAGLPVTGAPSPGGPAVEGSTAAGQAAAGQTAGSPAAGDPDAALRSAFRLVLGTTRSAFEARWRGYRAGLAR